jgi:hypothetical protein
LSIFITTRTPDENLPIYIRLNIQTPQKKQNPNFFNTQKSVKSRHNYRLQIHFHTTEIKPPDFWNIFLDALETSSVHSSITRTTDENLPVNITLNIQTHQKSQNPNSLLKKTSNPSTITVSKSISTPLMPNQQIFGIIFL